MKTKNNVQKTILRPAAVIISFVLISITVSAQGFWKKLIENSSLNEIAIAMITDSDKTKDSGQTKKEVHPNNIADKTANYVLETKFPELAAFEYNTQAITPEVKNEQAQKSGVKTFDNSLFETGVNAEEPLKLESWMTSDEMWK